MQNFVKYHLIGGRIALPNLVVGRDGTDLILGISIGPILAKVTGLDIGKKRFYP